MTRALIADIYLGRITKWSDPAIARLNPGVRLPNLRVTGRPSIGRLRHHLHFHRLPFPRLAGVEEKGGRERAWNGRRRAASAARATRAWPALVRQTPGAIGYVELAYLLREKACTYDSWSRTGRGKYHLPLTFPRSRRPRRRSPTCPQRTSRSSMLRGPGCYPISGYSWLLLYRNPTAPRVARSSRQ